MKVFKKIVFLGFVAVLGSLPVSCTVLRAVYGIPEPQESEASIRKKITSAVDKASNELIASLPERIRIAVLSSSSSGGSDQEVVIAYYKANGYSDSNARSLVQSMDRQDVSTLAGLVRMQGTNVQVNSYADYAVEDLEYNLVKAGFRLVDRQQIERIRGEQDFQLSGDVDDNSAVSIGKMAGASVVVIINVNYTDGSGRLTLKALDVQTAEIITMARQEF
jgi:hypothetical protein